MGQPMDLNEILVFTKVAQVGSFTRAARELELPKSTVSRKVSELEIRLGARLLQRTTRKVSLTDVGAAFHQRCARIVAQMEEAEEEVSWTQEAPRGLLRVTAPNGFAALLCPVLSEFLRTFEQARLEVVFTDRKMDLVGEGIDLAVRVGPLADSTLIARLLGRGQGHLMASPAYLKRFGIPRTPNDLNHHTFLLFGAAQDGGRWKLVKGSRTVTVEGSSRLVANDFDVLAEMAMAGHGIARLPVQKYAVRPSARRLTRVLPGWHGTPVPIYAVYPTTRHLAPKSKAFLEILVAHLPAQLESWGNSKGKSR